MSQVISIRSHPRFRGADDVPDVVCEVCWVEAAAFRSSRIRQIGPACERKEATGVTPPEAA